MPLVQHTAVAAAAPLLTGTRSKVYALALERGRGSDDRCLHCMPSGGGDSPFSFRSFDCVCALAPKPRAP